MASLGAFGAAATLRLPGAEGAPTSGAAQSPGVMKCRPYLQAPQGDRITVRWLTQVPSHSWVEFGEDPAALPHKAVQVEDGMIQSDNTIHAITLTGLQPGRTYHYRVVSREVTNFTRRNVAFGRTEASEVYAFQTPAASASQATFAMLNDIHDRPESFAQLLGMQEGKTKDFVFLNGDMFNRQDDEDQIVKHLLDPLTQQFASRTPFYFGRGNHETWGSYSRKLREYFDGAEQKFYYSFSHGPLCGIVLDSGESKPDDDKVHGGMHAFDAYREAQARWLHQEVQKPAFVNAAFRVVFVHIPPFYMNEPVHASLHSRELWGPILNAAKIDLMLCGHTHRHGVHPAVAGQHNFPIVIGGGPLDGKRTLTEVKVDERALRLAMKDDRGRRVGELHVPRA